MKIFFDTEFTGLRKDTTLISIGLVTEDGDKFYGELTDYDESMCDEWIRLNVLGNLFLHHEPEPAENETFVIGKKNDVAAELILWLSKYKKIELVSDVSHYDMVLLIDLLAYGGTAFDMPTNIPAVCHDINQDIARHYNVSDEEAFDMSREEIATKLCGKEIDGRKHNALYDAEVIRAIYKELHP